MNGNVITANFRGGRTTMTAPLWQYDYGQVLRFTGVSLPETYEVHFSNAKRRGDAKTAIGDANGVVIPDEFLATGDNVYAWIFLHATQEDGETEYMATIPVNKRATPSDEAPTPQEQSAITQAIAALNSAVVDVQEAVDAADSARASATSAASSATAAAASEAGVEADADRASNAATAAESAQVAAEAAQSGAETAQTGAESARDEAAEASAAQIAQINATGAAVLESIPADYTELSDSVSDLKSEIGDYEPIVYTSLEQGGFGPNGINNTSSAAVFTKRLRTSGFSAAEAGETYRCYYSSEKTMQFSVSFYADDDFTTPRIGYTGWFESGGAYTVPSGANFVRLLFMSSPEDTIIPEDITGVMSTLSISERLDQLENVQVPFCSVTKPFSAPFVFTQRSEKTLAQTIAQYNGEIFEFAPGKCLYNGDEIAITNGHGNNCNFGAELHGSYPYLYCPSWNKDTCNIYVNSFDGSNFELIDTIHIDKPGYLNAYVDEVNDVAYCFIANDPYIGDITSIKMCLSTKTILGETVLPYKMPILQGIDMFNGCLYLLGGYGNAQYPGYIYRIGPDGTTLLDKYNLIDAGEPEGIVFIDKKPVIASTNYIYRT